MKKSLFLLAALFIVAQGIEAAPVNLPNAQKVASHFWNTYRPDNVKPIKSFDMLTYDYLPHLYIFANGEQGFVIVASDNCVRPVLAYSFESAFPVEKEASPSLRYWLKDYESQIADAVANGALATSQTANEWNQLLSDTLPVTPISLQEVSPMLTATWDQGSPFNRKCPYDSVGGYRTVVGCVATAMAMTMHYWRHPACGTGSYSYTQYEPYATPSADFAHTTYIWNDMPSLLTESHSNAQINAVATLSYQCGVAVEMHYGSSSGAMVVGEAPSAESALINHFKYNPDKIHSHYRWGMSDSAWLAMVDTEMVARRPILYAGYDSAYTGGHAFVCDGSDLQARYHFNWGWNGYGNGYYTLSQLSPGVGGIGTNSSHDFSYGQQAIFGIEPLYEQFDTVEVFDSICNDARSYQFYEYTLGVADADTLLQHLDTVFLLHLRVVGRKVFDLDPNGGVGERSSHIFCLADGALLPACSFHKDSCLFVGWCLKRSGEGTIYQPGDVVHIQHNRTFYAIWNDTTQAVGIDNSSNALHTPHVYPNPTSNELYIAAPTQAEQLILIDALGRTVLREEMPKTATDGTVKISLQGLPVGIYTLQIKSSNSIYNQRIIKQ